ncbi:hypothetical protein [Kitasatospora sp. NPDC004272]
MIVCPHPDCDDPGMNDFEVETLYGLTGPRMYVTCPNEHRFEVGVFPGNLAQDQPAA